LEAGVIACPLNLRWPALKLAAALDDVDAAGVVYDETTRHLAEDPACAKFAALSIDELIDGSTTPSLRENYDERQPAVVVFTSGSTGSPKAALLSVGNVYHNAMGCNDVIPFHPGDCWLLSLPLYHVSGLGILFRSLLANAACAIPGKDEPLEDAMAGLGVTHLSCVAVQVQRILRREGGTRALAQLKAIMLGGGPVPATLIRECVRLDLPVHITYGMTETASQICTTRARVPMHALFTAGKPQEPDAIAIDEEGQIYVRGARRFLGYLSRGFLEQPFTPDGWFGTGDLGRFDEDGNLIPLGRMDNMFISGGENIHPETIERELGRMVGVDEAIVAPVPDAEFGQRPVAFVRMADGSAPDAEDLAAALRERLPGYAMPAAYFSWPADQVGGMKPNRGEFAVLAARLYSPK
jgi:o-succinylbenzoate---CoA ligase